MVARESYNHPSLAIPPLESLVLNCESDCIIINYTLTSYKDTTMRIISITHSTPTSLNCGCWLLPHRGGGRGGPPNLGRREVSTGGGRGVQWQVSPLGHSWILRNPRQPEQMWRKEHEYGNWQAPMFQEWQIGTSTLLPAYWSRRQGHIHTPRTGV